MLKKLLVTLFSIASLVARADLNNPDLESARESTLAAFSAKFSVLGQNTMANSQPVVIASNQSAIPVSGTFWQATQPVSCALCSTESTLSSLNTKVPSNLTVTSNRLLVDGSGVTQPVSGTFWQATQPISASALPLPAGAATETTLSTLNGKIPSNLTVTSTRLLVDGSGVTQPISAASLPLPSGAATSAKQDTVISSIQTLDDVVGSKTGGTAGTQSSLAGGVYNTSLPSLTNGQQAALQTDVNGRLLVSTTVSGNSSRFEFGDITTTASTKVVVQRTAYTEPTSSLAFSFKSSSANDSSAGTGARTIRVEYYDGSSSTISSETVTTNGTTCVNSVTTSARYIEDISVLTAGSTRSNVGTLTFYTGTGCTTTAATIAPTDNQTFWARHYVPTGRTMFITSLSVSHSGTTVGSGGVFTIRSTPLGVSNAITEQIGDFHRLYGQSSTALRTYSSPIQVTGPARVEVFVNPETTSSTVYRASFDYYEP